MRKLNDVEIESVQGAGWLGDVWDDAKRIIKELPGAYASAIDSATDMMCKGTGNC